MELSGFIELNMFDSDFDPYQVLQRHDEWVTLLAEQMEKMAQATVEHARTIDEQQRHIQHLAEGWNYHEQQIARLMLRLTELEKKCEHE